MSMTHEEFEENMVALIDAGVVGRWWCGPCDDWVPYRTELARDVIDAGGKPGQAYGEAESRRAHDARHQRTVGGGNNRDRNVPK